MPVEEQYNAAQAAGLIGARGRRSQISWRQHRLPHRSGARYGGGMIISWLRNRRRRRILESPFPGDWEALLKRRIRHYAPLPAPQRERVRAIVQVMVAEKEWAGVGGLDVAEDMK